MSVIPTNKASSAESKGGKQQTFWQMIAYALDAVAAQRSHRAVPAIALLRSKNEVDRCRRLMLGASRTAPTGGVNIRG